MCIRNIDGKLIVKNIPINLYGLYLNIGWIEYEEIEEKPLKKTFRTTKIEEE